MEFNEIFYSISIGKPLYLSKITCAFKSIKCKYAISILLRSGHLSLAHMLNQNILALNRMLIHTHLTIDKGVICLRFVDSWKATFIYDLNVKSITNSLKEIIMQAS